MGLVSLIKFLKYSSYLNLQCAIWSLRYSLLITAYMHCCLHTSTTILDLQLGRGHNCNVLRPNLRKQSLYCKLFALKFLWCVFFMHCKKLHTRFVLVVLYFVSSIVFCAFYLWSPYVIGQTIIFSSCGFFFFPRLISAVEDWMSTILPHMVWP